MKYRDAEKALVSILGLVEDMSTKFHEFAQTFNRVFYNLDESKGRARDLQDNIANLRAGLEQAMESDDPDEVASIVKIVHTELMYVGTQTGRVPPSGDVLDKVREKSDEPFGKFFDLNLQLEDEVKDLARALKEVL